MAAVNQQAASHNLCNLINAQSHTEREEERERRRERQSVCMNSADSEFNDCVFALACKNYHAYAAYVVRLARLGIISFALRFSVVFPIFLLFPNISNSSSSRHRYRSNKLHKMNLKCSNTSRVCTACVCAVCVCCAQQMQMQMEFKML